MILPLKHRSTVLYFAVFQCLLWQKCAAVLLLAQLFNRNNWNYASFTMLAAAEDGNAEKLQKENICEAALRSKALPYYFVEKRKAELPDYLLSLPP
jgi:hypothetical protein